MLAHTDWDSTEVNREIEAATLAGNPSCTDTTSVELSEDTRERGPHWVRINVIEQTLSIPLYNMATNRRGRGCVTH
eukprot:4428859-Pleurochrysis_carterae.AAC.1